MAKNDDVGIIKKDAYGNEFVNINFYGDVFRFKVKDVYKSEEEYYHYNINNPDKTYKEKKTIVELEEV